MQSREERTGNSEDIKLFSSQCLPHSPFIWSILNCTSRIIIFIFRLRKLKCRKVRLMICSRSQLVSGSVIDTYLWFILGALPHHCLVKWSPISGNIPSSREFKVLGNFTPSYHSRFISHNTLPHSLCTFQIGCPLTVLDNCILSFLHICWSLNVEWHSFLTLVPTATWCFVFLIEFLFIL